MADANDCLINTFIACCTLLNAWVLEAQQRQNYDAMFSSSASLLLFPSWGRQRPLFPNFPSRLWVKFLDSQKLMSFGSWLQTHPPSMSNWQSRNPELPAVLILSDDSQVDYVSFLSGLQSKSQEILSQLPCVLYEKQRRNLGLTKVSFFHPILWNVFTEANTNKSWACWILCDSKSDKKILLEESFGSA